MKWLAMGVPLRPRTPHARGWASEIRPLPLKVVITGQRRRSARATTRSMSNRAPWPTMMAGLRDFLRRARAASRESSGGAIALEATRPRGPPAVAPSSAGRVCTSSGKIRCETPRFRIALLQARLTSSACLLVCSTGCDHCATLPNAAWRSTSWKAPGPSTWVSTWPVSASTGARSTLASHRPVSRLVAPGPAIARHAAGLPVSFPYA